MTQLKKHLKFFFTRYWLDVLILLSLIGITVFFFVTIRRPPPMSDPTDYFFTAQYTSWVEPTHRHLRYGLMWPLWILQQIFGYSELSYYALPLIALVALSTGTYLLGQLVFNKTTGFFAALFVLINPPIVEQGSMLLPDFLSPGLFLMGFVTVLSLGKAGLLTNPKPEISTRTALLISGILLGWSYLTREFILIVFPALIFLLYIHKASRRSIAWLSAPFLAILTVEMIWNLWWYGNPFIRFLVSSEPRDSSRITTDAWKIITQLPQILVEWPGGWVLVAVFFAALVGGLWMWKRDPERWGAISLWFVGGWLFFSAVALLPVLFFDGKLTLLRTSVARYWVVIFPPMFVAGLGFLQKVLEQVGPRESTSKRKFLSTLTMLGLFLLSFIGIDRILENYLYIRNGNTDYHEFRVFLGQYGDDYRVIWLNQPGRYTSVRAIPMYLNEWHGLRPIWRGQIEFYNTDDQDYLPLSQLTKGLLVLDLSNKNGLYSNHDLPDYLLDLSLLGEPVFESSHGSVLAFKLPVGD